MFLCLQAQKQQSLGNSLALRAVSSVLALVAAYWLFHMGLLLLYFSWAALKMSLEATVCILTATLTAAVGLLDLAFWRPRLWSSMALAVCMREFLASPLAAFLRNVLIPQKHC